MQTNEILKHVDHTLLLQGATWEEIRQICDDGVKYQTASVCIPPSYIKQAGEYVQGKVAICTVIGFPNGYMTTATKAFETKDALENGADEIDMVINIGWLKDKKYDAIENEIRTLKEICGGGREDQGSRRHLQHGRCGKIPGTRRGPSRNEPYHQTDQKGRSNRILRF